MKRILCFGDSNTWGYNGEDGSRFGRDVRWTGRLSRLLGKGYDVIEEGACGRTLLYEDPIYGPSGIRLIGRVLHENAPVDLLIVQLGTNDLTMSYGLSAEKIAAGMEQFITQARRSHGWRTDEKPILVLVPKPLDSMADSPENPFFYEKGCMSEKSALLSPLIRRTARQNACLYLDLDGLVSVNRTDYMHLDAEGHYALAKAVSTLLACRIFPDPYGNTPSIP